MLGVDCGCGVGCGAGCGVGRAGAASLNAGNASPELAGCLRWVPPPLVAEIVEPTRVVRKSKDDANIVDVKQCDRG